MIINFFILLLYLSKCRAGNTDVVAQNHLKIVQAGDTVNLTCISPKESRNSIVWVKQILGQKPISIVSSYQALPVEFDKGFDKHNRFFSAKDDTFFNLTITNTKESDTATYYCITFLYNFKFGHVTDLIVKGRGLNTPSEHERAVTDPDDPEDSVSLQCTVLTESCAGEHNVYWFRRKSGQSPPGVIFTQEHRNAGCERTSDINSAEHKCIYSLPKTNLGLSDAGIYYCAVAACGQIVFGDARKPDIPGLFQEPWSIIALILGTLNCLSVIVIIFLGTQLYIQRQKDGTRNIQIGHLVEEDRDALNYAALSFQQTSSTSRRPREKLTR
ncbi:novel immune-type receptor 2b isoform X1 [Puntigrus tetrazona]|uniref:novel immune-type receptor 2b isoform X1 n=1 Tax=Puntigrus tetrazona TaxID=1606681 RepID=UPI001C88E49C|nr:novel immune-type receptor 2b isoform X1 [Puntigrus tetrazona]